MTQDGTAESEAERHASWPELFFDLVAVAGVSVVAHQLESDQPWQHIAVLAVAFTAFWILWASVTTYGNLLADNASIAVLFASMAVLGVMVAAVPEIYGEHARAFAAAYVVGRLIIARPWSRAAVVVDMPIVQATIGVIPWIVSIWVDGDARYIWWAVGISLDLWVLVTESGEKRVAHAQERLNRVLSVRERREGAATPERAARRSERLERYERSGREIPTTITALTGDAAHRGERMALFVLIVLGEGIVQLTVAAEASEHWNRALLSAAVGAFLLVCGLFLIGVVRGTAGLARLQGAQLPVRALWVCHLVVAMSLVTLVAALGKLLEEPKDPIDLHTALMLSLGLATYALISMLAIVAGSDARRWKVALAVGAPMFAGAALVLSAHATLAASAVAWILATSVAAASLLGGAVLYPRRSRATANAD